MLVWLGDFNYRVDAEYGEAKGLVRRNDLSPLLSKVPLPTQHLYLGPYHDLGRNLMRARRRPVTCQCL